MIDIVCNAFFDNFRIIIFLKLKSIYINHTLKSYYLSSAINIFFIHNGLSLFLYHYYFVC